MPNVEKAVPICPIRREWHSQTELQSRTMLPLILGYSLSIHKLQGETLKKVILNLSNAEFSPGLTLVGATRVRKFIDLAFNPYPNFDRFNQINKRKEIKERMQEEKRLLDLSVKTLQKVEC